MLAGEIFWISPTYVSKTVRYCISVYWLSIDNSEQPFSKFVIYYLFSLHICKWRIKNIFISNLFFNYLTRHFKTQKIGPGVYSHPQLLTLYKAQTTYFMWTGPSKYSLATIGAIWKRTIILIDDATPLLFFLHSLASPLSSYFKDSISIISILMK